MTVITTNYDIVGGRMLFQQQHKSRRRGSCVNCIHYAERGLDSFTQTITTSNWSNCHGSLNWRKNDDGEILCENAIVSHDSIQDVLVAPTPKEKNRTNAPFNELLGRFDEILHDLDLLVVIGFSFRDEKLCEMIKKKADDRMRVGLRFKNVGSLANKSLPAAVC